jgi:tetratricopeptide (TPR) repeat protein
LYVKKSQLIFVGVAVLATMFLFFFGRTVPKSNDITKSSSVQTEAQHNSTILRFEDLLDLSKKRLSPSLLQQVEVKEKELSLLTDSVQKIGVYRSLARLWMDSVGVFVPFAKYTAEAAKLEKSEKNLNFAAQLLLEEALSVQEKPLQSWMAREARDIFEQYLRIRPDNDSVKIGLGSCYFFGAAKDGEPPMKGVMLIREIAERDPDNAYAQRMLGIGAAESGQKEKAVERFQNVYRLEPDNMDVLLRLANLYEQSGDKKEAKKWYQELVNVAKRMEKENKFNPGPDMIRQLEEHIKELDK